MEKKATLERKHFAIRFTPQNKKRLDDYIKEMLEKGNPVSKNKTVNEALNKFFASIK